MSVDQKGHASIAAGEAPTRAGLAKGFLSINDLVPVANVTARAQMKSALAGTDYPISQSRPLTVHRQDAPALHAIESTRDGDVYVPASGVLQFANDAARDDWTSANSALLVKGDRCVSNGFDGRWDGAKWLQDTPWTPLTLTNGWGTYLGETPKFRVQGGVFFGAGRITGPADTDPTFAVLSSGQRHSLPHVLVYRVHMDNALAGIAVGSDGVMSVFEPGRNVSRSGVSLAQVTYPIG